LIICDANVVNAGQAIPVKFSLSGNKGLNIFAAGYPASGQIACDASEPGSEIEKPFLQAAVAWDMTLVPIATTYVLENEKAWNGTCRILALRLRDGSDHFAKFRFK
jgi:hypothetical protein